MSPFPTCKGPEGDKLQGTIVHHFFRIHFGTHYSKLKKSLEPFLPKLRKSAILAQIFPFWAQNGEGDFFHLFRSLFYISRFPTSCQISRKSLEPFSVKVRHGRTAGQPDKSHFIGPFPENRRPKMYQDLYFWQVNVSYFIKMWPKYENIYFF